MRNKVNLNTLQKCKLRENKTPEHYEAHLIKKREKKWKRKAVEITEEWDARCTYYPTTAAESKYVRAGLRHSRAVRSECRSSI
ncbi:14695_t:CDS:2 [Funneliformis mosseae]|uniref:14695_t:CDS:1 n=1 Tax=Funneliformis mosseae TaxID=27381 RepID=A0A9N9FGS8_FUNMO|nr:14695_t:CDS:2 [Funneliformis mosseae]